MDRGAMPSSFYHYAWPIECGNSLEKFEQVLSAPECLEWKWS